MFKKQRSREVGGGCLFVDSDLVLRKTITTQMIGSLHSVLVSRVSRKEKRVDAGGGTGKSLLTGLPTLDSWQPSQDCDHRRRLTARSAGLWPQEKANSQQDCDHRRKLTVYRTVTTAEGWQSTGLWQRDKADSLQDCDHRRNLSVYRTVTTRESWQSTGLWPQEKADSLQDCDHRRRLTVYRTVTTGEGWQSTGPWPQQKADSKVCRTVSIGESLQSIGLWPQEKADSLPDCDHRRRLTVYRTVTTAEGWQRGLQDCDHNRRLTVYRTVTTGESRQSTGLWPRGLREEGWEVCFSEWSLGDWSVSSQKV